MESVAIGVVAGVLTLFSFSVVLIAGVVIVAGVFLNIGLNNLDDTLSLSANLKEELRTALKEYQKINEWNFQHSDSLFNHPFGSEY